MTQPMSGGNTKRRQSDKRRGGGVIFQSWRDDWRLGAFSFLQVEFTNDMRPPSGLFAQMLWSEFRLSVARLTCGPAVA